MMWIARRCACGDKGLAPSGSEKLKKESPRKGRKRVSSELIQAIPSWHRRVTWYLLRLCETMTHGILKPACSLPIIFTSIGNLTDNSTSYRVYIWMGTLAMLKDYWMCGIGPGDAAFNLVYPKYSYSGIVAPHAHNLFLQIVCDAGVVALVVFVLLLFHYFRDLCAAFCREKDPFSRLYQTAAVSGIAGFLVQAMTDYSFYNYRVLLLFWAWLALGALLARRGQLPERGLKV